MAFSCIAEMTDGETRGQILHALGVDDIFKLREIADLIWRRNNVESNYGCCKLASSVWLNEGYRGKFRKPIIRTLNEKYHSDVFVGEMGTGGLNQAVQNWVNQNTGNQLKRQTLGISLESDTALALFSTIYYKSEWIDEFDEDETQAAAFHGQSEVSECQMMYCDTFDQYFRGEHFGAVSLALSHAGSMFFVLPDEDVLLDDILGGDDFYELIAQGCNYENHREVRLQLYVPKFSIHESTALIPLMQEAGVKKVFNAVDADFSKFISRGDPLYVSKAEHAAALEINEQGASGVAYTEIKMALTDMPHFPDEEIIFKLNRPFLYILWTADGSILFAGAIRNL